MEFLKLIVPILLLIGGFVTWIIQNRIEKLNKLKEELFSLRRERYLKTLEPSIKTMSKTGGGGVEQAIKQMKTFDYKKIIFEFNLYGSDEVIKSFNNYMQNFYKKKDGETKSDTGETMNLLGELLLSIRKDLGNKDTKLAPVDMLRSFINDIDDYL